MAKSYRPTSPGIRAKTTADFSDLSDKKPEASLTTTLKKRSGRNCYGRITVRRRGGGNRRKYRIIDWKRNKVDVPAKVTHLEYDPNRSARLALIEYEDGDKSYILAPLGVVVGQEVISGDNVEPVPGNCLPLRSIPVGTMVHCVELSPGRGAQIVRSAGAGAQIAAKEGRYAQLRLPSGEIRKILLECKATVGVVGNIEHENIVIGKAGRSRHLGHRPKVRGKVMNPVDHPHGGGEGRNPIGMPSPMSPWGKPTRGVKTRKRNKDSNKYIVRSRKR